MNSTTAEEYMRLIMHTLSHHRRSEYAIGQYTSVLQGRLISLPSGVVSRQVRINATLVRVVSIAESFASSQLAARLEAQAPQPRTPFVEELYIGAEDAAISSWERIKDGYKNWVYNVQLASCPGYDSVRALAEVRNAVTHGLGRLTRRQLRSKQMPTRITQLKRLGIYIDTNHRVLVSDDALKTAALECRSFVSALDSVLQSTATPC